MKGTDRNLFSKGLESDTFWILKARKEEEVATLEREYRSPTEVQEKQQEMPLAKEYVTGLGMENKIKEEKDTIRPSILVFLSQKIDRASINIMDWVFRGVFPI